MGAAQRPGVLKACIPGCQSLERTGDNGFAAVVKIKIGPVAATFKGKVELSDIVPEVGYTITGEGEGGVAGFAKGGAKVSLADAEGGARCCDTTSRPMSAARSPSSARA